MQMVATVRETGAVHK